MTETHPLVEAVARAIDRVVSDDMPQSCFLTTDELRAAALAASRVILSASPTMTDDLTMALGAAYGRSYGRGGGSPHKHALAALVRASNAALLREIEGE